MTTKAQFIAFAMSIALAILFALAAIVTGARLSAGASIWPIPDLILLGGAGFVSGAYAMWGDMFGRNVDRPQPQ
jgi:hypothetical protein